MGTSATQWPQEQQGQVEMGPSAAETSGEIYAVITNGAHHGDGSVHVPGP